MGYRGKLAERSKARELRARGLTMIDIAAALGVSKSSVSLWTRDVPFQPRLILHRRPRAANALQRRKAAEIEQLKRLGVARIGQLSRKEFLVAGAALYAAEGSKTDGQVIFCNTDPRMLSFFCAWLRRFFAIDESRLRLRLYLHEGLDLEAATRFWCEVTDIPRAQVQKPYRAAADSGFRTTKHLYGCATVRYGCSATHRGVMGLAEALLGSNSIPG